MTTCEVCRTVVEEASSLADVRGRCHIREFRHRRVLLMSLASPFGESGGSLCRHLPRRHTGLVLPCGPEGCPHPPVPRSCCTLTTSFAPFDKLHPPVEITGTYTCVDETGMYTLVEDGS